jgi:glucose-1-phosphate cytidylyltransferase
MKVVLFCGGLGTRLGEFTGEIPKPLVKIGPRPIIWHLMKYYAHFGHKDFILGLGYLGEKIKEYFIEYEDHISNNFRLACNGKKIFLENRDLDDWSITFVDTGLRSNIGERLRAVEGYLGDEEVFLANYSDGLTDTYLPDVISRFHASGKTASMLCVKPSQSFSIIRKDAVGTVKSIEYARSTDLLINGGFFVFKKEIFAYIESGEELVEQPFSRLIDEGQLMGYECDSFWACMDTFKEHKELTDMYNNGAAPWAVWLPRQGGR